MKKLFYLVLAVVLITGCKKESEEEESQFVVNASDLKGEIPEGDNIVLDASKTYKLTGALIVKGGATLTIPAGTRIEATPTDDISQVRYIAVERDAIININGTATAPVVMTSEVKEASKWGGLVICGNAVTNVGTDVSAEVSGLLYGGSDNADNSGSITYLRVEYTGFKYSDTKEFNGVSLFGVGSGTTFEYVVSYKGGDDGIEFFGGAVNGKYLVSVDSEDDGIDFADGWSGAGENWYVLNASKSGIEGSNNGNNGAAEPLTNATLKNLTIYKMGEKPWYLKEGAGKQNIDNVVIGGLKDDKAQAYFYTDDDDAPASDRITAGDVKITNVKFIEMGNGNDVKAVEGLTVTENENATGAGAGTSKPSWLSDALNSVDATTKVLE